jgi:imidazolonepropionase-like amidohydrolase
MRMEGWTREDGALRDPAAITVFWPDLTIDRSPDAARSVEKQKKDRDERVRKLKDAFHDARAYAAARAAEGKAGVPRHDADARMEALAPAIDGKIPVVVRADRLEQIRDALSWAREEKLLLVIWGGADAWRAADELAKAGVAVVVDSPVDLPLRSDEAYDTQYANAAKLNAAGVRVIFNEGGSPDGASNVRNLPLYVGAAVAYGFPREKALPAVTLEPARLLGVADRVGSLEPGKDADFAIWNGSPLSPYAHCEQTWIEGRKYFDRSEDLAGREALARERAALIDLARRGKNKNPGGGGDRRAMPRYLQDADRSGNGCSGEDMPFVSDAERRAEERGER